MFFKRIHSYMHVLVFLYVNIKKYVCMYELTHVECLSYLHCIVSYE